MKSKHDTLTRKDFSKFKKSPRCWALVQATVISEFGGKDEENNNRKEDESNEDQRKSSTSPYRNREDREKRKEGRDLLPLVQIAHHHPTEKQVQANHQIRK
eukprot:TCONS_00032429-protein